MQFKYAIMEFKYAIMQFKYAIMQFEYVIMQLCYNKKKKTWFLFSLSHHINVSVLVLNSVSSFIYY